VFPDAARAASAVDVGMIGREPQAICLEGLQVPELRQDVDLGSHLALHLERDKAAEDGRELGSTEVVDGIGRREFHVDELIMRAASHGVEELSEKVAFSGLSVAKAAFKSLIFVLSPST